MMLRQKLLRRELSLGSWLTFPCEASAEIMARAGFDWLVLDMEHAPLGVAEVARLIRVITLSGTSVLCRLSSNDATLAKNVLDAGATGIIVPMIESVEDAERAVEAAYYPPQGRRGVGLARAQGYGSNFEEYRAHFPDTVVVIAMIETQRGVMHAEEIVAVPGIQGVLIGPYDLSGSLGRIGQLDHPEVKVAKQCVIQAAARVGIGCGLHVVHPTTEQIQSAAAEGYTFLALGVDMILLGEAARALLRSVSTKPLKEKI